MALPLVLSFSCIACAFLPLCLPCLPSALASVNIIINFTLNAGVLGLIVEVGEALDFNIRALLKASDSLFKASDSLFKASDCRISSFGAPSF